MERRASYEDLTASALFCPTCRRAVPVRQRLLLLLPDGELHEYLCRICRGSLGTKKVGAGKERGIILP